MAATLSTDPSVPSLEIGFKDASISTLIFVVDGAEFQPAAASKAVGNSVFNTDETTVTKF